MINQSKNPLGSDDMDLQGALEVEENGQRMDFNEEPTWISKEQLDFLKLFDPELKLGIWESIEDTESDPIISEYIQLITKHKFFPSAPPEGTLEIVNNVGNINIPSKVEADLVHLFTKYFQINNQIMNIGKATQHDISLFNPSSKDFRLVGYQDLPNFFFKRRLVNKTMYAKLEQTEALLAQQVTSELYLLRAYDIIDRELTKLLNNIDDDRQFLFVVIFTGSKKNFSISKKIRDIDWSKKKGKAHSSLPTWRRNEKEPPKVMRSKYAQHCASAIEQGLLKFTKNLVQDNEKLFESIKKAVPTKVASKVTNPPEKEKGITGVEKSPKRFRFKPSQSQSKDDNVRKSVKDREIIKPSYKHKENKQFIANRNISNFDISLIDSQDSQSINNSQE